MEYCMYTSFSEYVVKNYCLIMMMMMMMMMMMH